MPRWSILPVRVPAGATAHRRRGDGLGGAGPLPFVSRRLRSGIKRETSGRRGACAKYGSCRITPDRANYCEFARVDLGASCEATGSAAVDHVLGVRVAGVVLRG